MGETKARCEEDLTKLAHDFETLGTSSPGTSKSRRLVDGRAAYVDKRPCVPCNECSKSHPPYSVCPFVEGSCRICDKAHYSDSCPYLRHLPRGAKFNPGYEIVCACGNYFNADRWDCPSCGGSMPLLDGKHCSICNVHYEHAEYECPKDKVLAAEYKSVLDKKLSHVSMPYKPVYPDTLSGIPYVPTAPSSRVCEDMKEGKDPVYVPDSSSGITYSPTAPSSSVSEDMKEGKDPVYVPESSSGITYSPTAPSSSVCEERKEGKDPVYVSESSSGITYTPPAFIWVSGDLPANIPDDVPIYVPTSIDYY